MMKNLDILDCVDKKQHVACMAGPYNDQDKGLNVKVVKLP